MHEHHLDDAIDRAVREMMDVDAEPAFRARVFERLERPRRGYWWRGSLALASAALAVLAVVMLTREPARDNERRAVHTPASVAPPAPVPRPAAAPPGSATNPPPPTAAPTVARRQAAGSSRRPANATQDVPPGALVATVAGDGIALEGAGEIPGPGTTPPEGIEAIRIAPLELHAIETTPIAIAPLSPLSEVQVAPLSPFGGRD